jgi:hypothetical protein
MRGRRPFCPRYLTQAIALHVRACWRYLGLWHGPTCGWHDDSPDDPVVLFEELNKERLETRKVEEFGDACRVAQTAFPELNTVV